MKESFGSKLKTLRKEQGLSQIELANALGVGKSVVSLYEKDDCEPTASKIVAISKYFKVSADYLLGLKDFPD